MAFGYGFTTSPSARYYNINIGLPALATALAATVSCYRYAASFYRRSASALLRLSMVLPSHGQPTRLREWVTPQLEYWRMLVPRQIVTPPRARYQYGHGVNITVLLPLTLVIDTLMSAFGGRLIGILMTSITSKYINVHGTLQNQDARLASNGRG